MYDTHYSVQNILIVRMRVKRLTARAAQLFTQAANQALHSGHSAILFDMSKTTRLTTCGLAAVIELFAAHDQKLTTGFFGLQPKVDALLQQYGLAANLPIFETVDAALVSPRFRRRRLAGHQAVILCADAIPSMAPLNWDAPSAMLDFLGKPLLEHAITHLESFGIDDICLNPGHLGDQIFDHYGRQRHRNILFSNEGIATSEGWHGQPVGSASTLRQLDRHNSFFRDDFFVLSSNALTNINYAELMSAHKASDAMVTQATTTETPSQPVRTNIYVFSPDALPLIGAPHGQDIEQDLLPALRNAGATINDYEAPFSYRSIQCGRDYRDTLSEALAGDLPDHQPTGQQIRPGIWADVGVQVSSSASFEGPCFIGAGSTIGKNARIIGPSVIGTDCQIGKHAELRRSVLQKNSILTARSVLADHIASPFWAIQSNFADGRTDCADPVPQVLGPQAMTQPVSTWQKFLGA